MVRVLILFPGVLPFEVSKFQVKIVNILMFGCEEGFNDTHAKASLGEAAVATQGLFAANTELQRARGYC